MMKWVSVRGDRRYLLLFVLGALGCSLLEGTPQSNEDDDGCEDGEVRECTGPQGCSGLTVCQDGRAGDCVCGSGGAGGTGGTSGGGMGCDGLRACCESEGFDASARQSCLDLADTGIESACSSALTTYQDVGICGGGGGGTSGGGTSGGGGTSSGAGGSAASGAGGSGNQGGTGNGGTSTGGTGPTQPTCGASWQVRAGGYVTAPSPYVNGVCWLGYAYTSVSATATISPTSFSSCTDNCGLCVQGSVPATSDYSGYALVGFNLAETFDSRQKTTATLRGTALEFTYSNPMGAPLRVQMLGANGDTSANERWCALLPATEGTVMIPYSSFNTQCWEGGMGVAYAGQPIAGIQLMVPGGNATAIPYNICLIGAIDAITVQ